MASSRLLPVLALGLLVLVAGFAVSATYDKSGQERMITVEFTPSPGSITTFNESNHEQALYDQDPRVITNVSGPNPGPSFLAAEGEDYDWFSENGTLRTSNTGVLANAANAQITFTYYAPLQEQRGMAALAAGEIEVARLLILIGVVGAVITAVWRLGSV